MRATSVAWRTRSPSAEDGPIDAELARALADRFGSQVRFDEALARYVSLRVGGPADALLRAETRDDLVAVARLCREHGVVPHWLGAGFNTLFRDGGVRGVVVRVGARAAEVRDQELRVEAGTSHTRATRAAAEAGLAGLEFGVGIPGTLGGWVAMNAGTREREMADALAWVEWVDVDSGRIERRERAALRFAYRRGPLPAGACALAAGFALEPDDPERIRERMAEQMAQRRATQPVDQPSCGSVFKNPPGEHAGRLIEAAGLKGAQVGAARISELHANFITTEPGARAGDVLELIERARDAVAAATGIELVCEVRIEGEDA